MSDQFDKSSLMMIIGNWMESFQEKHGLAYIEWMDLYNAIVDFVVDAVNSNRKNKKRGGQLFPLSPSGIL